MAVESLDVTHPDLLAPKNLEQILDKIRPYTMVPDASLIDLAWQVCGVLATGVPGDFVECGVWRGGASFLVAELLRQAGIDDRKVWLFDSFEGMPPPEEIDDAAAKAWADSTGAELPIYGSPDAPSSENYVGSLAKVQAAARELGLSSYTECVKGWFDQTLPTNSEGIGPIALLRVDCDWHSSVICCLETLYDQVSEAAVVIFDDYYTFDGCAVAVHEFLGRRGLAHTIESVSGEWNGSQEYLSARFSKGGAGWHWRRRFLQTTRELSRVIAPEDPFILVDHEQYRGDLASGFRAIPFLEKDGVYWGAPADDATAISELDRLRDRGARYFVYANPCFWWLDCYPGFTAYLRSIYSRVVENDDVIIFDLRG